MRAMASTSYGSDRSEQAPELWLAIDSAPALIHTGQPDGYLDFFNQTWLQYLGLRLEEVEGWKWIAYIHPEDVDGIVNKWRASLASGEPFLHEARVRRADGEYRWMLHHKIALRNEQGKVVKWYGSSIDIEDRKRAVEELQRSEFYLAEGQRLAHMGSWAFDPSGFFDYWSQELFRIYGLDPDKQAPSLEQYLATIHPQDREFMARMIDKMLTEGLGCDVKKRIVRPDGEVRYIRCVGVPVTDNGALKRIVGTAIDVTVQEQLTQELRRRGSYLAEAQRLSHTGSFGWNVTTGELFWSDETFRVFEYDRTLKPTVDLVLQRVHPEDTALVKETIERASLDGDFDVEHRLLMPSGTVKYLHVIGHSLQDLSGNLEFVGAVTDVTTAKEAEENIRQSEREFRQILDLAPQHVAVLGADGTAMYLNKVGLDYRGLTLDEWLKFDPRLTFHPEDHEHILTSAGRAKFLSEQAYETEARLARKDGKYRWFLFHFNPLRDEQGRITRWYVAATDIEDRKQAEERLQNENVALREEVDQASMFEEILGTSPPLQKALSLVCKVAPRDCTVLVTGETGTGKELVARAIHRRSQRSTRAFVSVNCAAMPRDLIASELFGHEKGAFTGATQRRLGRFELAGGGTIFLDEVGELPAETQIALLHVLQEHEFERVGGSRSIPTDVRVIAATNRDLEAAVTAGTFRSDLFYRLNVFPIELPPLRERKEDIPMLMEYFIDRFARKAGKSIRGVSKKTLQLLQSYAWPGNIRELQNVIERSVIVCESESFSVDESWLARRPLANEPKSQLELSEKLAAQEKEMIEAALRETGGRVSGSAGAAASLGIPRSTLESKIRSLKINKNRFKT
jgi:PAS domain S-box-containing protein